MSAPVMIMAGGTGGHIFPGLAVARELQKRGVPVVWLGGKVGLETKLVPQAGLELESLEFAGVRGKGMLTLLLAPLRLLKAAFAARAVFKRVQPRSVLSMGGYAAAPGGIAARLAGVPLVVHEQNRVPGVTNRMLARFASHVLTGFENSFPQGEWVGNPVRTEIAAIESPAQRFAARDDAIRVLVLGGSQGAQSLNQQLPQVFQRRGHSVNLQIRHQCGEKHLQKTREIYAVADVDAVVEPFIDDMAAAYAWADIVVCRAGALTLAELCVAGLPSVLVPYPSAVDDHQTRNAEVLVEAGAARLVAEGGDFIKRLGVALDELVRDREQLLVMANAARRLARPEAVKRIADICLEDAA
jgi:UDP-N-acetylglucosamine--N-acetylmuramyl-(pentapeptide) pyrophosphoryl-undecaprenol N-acetylglucosamine transferase